MMKPSTDPAKRKRSDSPDAVEDILESYSKQSFLYSKHLEEEEAIDRFLDEQLKALRTNTTYKDTHDLDFYSAARSFMGPSSSLQDDRKDDESEAASAMTELNRACSLMSSVDPCEVLDSDYDPGQFFEHYLEYCPPTPLPKLNGYNSGSVANHSSVGPNFGNSRKKSIDFASNETPKVVVKPPLPKVAVPSHRHSGVSEVALRLTSSFKTKKTDKMLASKRSTVTKVAKKTKSGRAESSRPTPEDVWAFMYKELKKFQGKHGHAIIPTNIKGKEGYDPRLGQWAKRQRAQYKLYCAGKRSSFCERKVKMLDEIQFCWDLPTHKWNLQFEDLYRHAQEDDDQTKLPRKLKEWLERNRKNHEKGELKQEFLEKLESLGFAMV